MKVHEECCALGVFGFVSCCVHGSVGVLRIFLTGPRGEGEEMREDEGKREGESRMRGGQSKMAFCFLWLRLLQAGTTD